VVENAGGSKRWWSKRRGDLGGGRDGYTDPMLSLCITTSVEMTPAAGYHTFGFFLNLYLMPTKLGPRNPLLRTSGGPPGSLGQPSGTLGVAYAPSMFRASLILYHCRTFLYQLRAGTVTLVHAQRILTDVPRKATRLIIY
jgi:hypothetical protein